MSKTALFESILCFLIPPPPPWEPFQYTVKSTSLTTVRPGVFLNVHLIYKIVYYKLLSEKVKCIKTEQKKEFY